MIKGICKNKTLENFPVKIFKNTAKLTKIPMVEKPIVLNMVIIQPPRLTNETLFQKLLRLRREEKLREQRRIEQQEALRLQEIAEERMREQALQRQQQEAIRLQRIEEERIREQELLRQQQEAIRLQRIEEERIREQEVILKWLESRTKTKTKTETFKNVLADIRETVTYKVDDIKYSILYTIAPMVKNATNKIISKIEDKLYDIKYDIKYTIAPKVKKTTNKIVNKSKDKVSDMKYNFKYNIAPPIIEFTDTTLTHTKDYLKTKQAQTIFLSKLNKYKNLAPDFAYMEPFKDWTKANITELQVLSTRLDKEIARAQMVNGLKQKIIKGADFYLPHNWKSKFELNNLLEIKAKETKPDNSKEYREELKRLCNLFENNSESIESGIIIFNKIVSNFFTQSSKNIKEIFNLKNNQANKWLERIPKLGFIPKTLRITEQLALTGCIMKDYKELSQKHFQKTIIPYFKQYNKQYNDIENFVHKNQQYLSEEDKQFTEKMMNKMKILKDRRNDTNNNIISSFTTGGMNISNICKNIRIHSSIELATKTLSTFMTLF